MSDWNLRLLDLCRALFRFSIPVQGNFGNLRQVKVVPLQAVTCFIGHLKIPMDVLFVIVKGDLDALAGGQRVLAKDVFFPIVGAVWRDVERMKLNVRIVVQDKVLLAGAREREDRRRKKDRGHTKRDYNS